MRNPVPAEAIELVNLHGSRALLIARTHLAQARDADDEIRSARWQVLSEAIATILEDRKGDAPLSQPPTHPADMPERNHHQQ